MNDDTPVREMQPRLEGRCCEHRDPISHAGDPGTSSEVRSSLDRPDCCEQRECVIRIDGLQVSYAGVPALRGVSMPIHRGCITAVVGASGCGKSTFLSSLNRLTDLIPTCTVNGRVLLDGRDILDRRIDVIALRRRVGMIFQKPNPFPLSIRKNLTFPLREHGVRDRTTRMHKAETALRQVGLWTEVKDRLDAPAFDLSGGQQQRLCLARALVLDPEVILLDEPCSALDPIASGVVEDMIAALRGRYTTVIVTHNLAQARRIADDVAMFWVEDGVGTLVEHGAAAKLFEAPDCETTAAYLRGARG
ncbi:phosphate ABC transporter ATP-binding protein [Lysobacter sp. D1-1-M9]|uniref:phosphate ABC transporter ATP-binding protein n=2 Tax=Novilysobacter TaxID=3382699 RepID=UPI002FC5B8E7